MSEKSLSDQYLIPKMGFGTYGRTGPEGVDAMLYALEVGYRHLDTAQTYGTDREVGETLQRADLPREAIFVTTKISTDNLDTGKLIPSLRRSLHELRLDRIDLTLIHWPAPNERLPVEVYIEQLAEAHALGLTRLIGVSNFTISHLKAAKTVLGDTPIANNQFEMNPYLQNSKLVNYCLNNDISVTCYLPIARGRLTGDTVIESIAQRHRATAEQVALAWEMQKGLIAIPTSGRRERIAANFRAVHLHLSADEMSAIDGLDRNSRVVDPEWGPKWD